MKPFPTIAVPHKDIIEDKLTMDVFAADLWEVFKGRAPEEYQDSDVFFKKTYQTNGLRSILEISQKRLKGEGGDPVIQLQTPFGGGKTHTLIALYHKAQEINAKTVVITGTAFDPKEVTIWEEMEKQLTGKVEKLKGQTAPGKEKIRDLLMGNQPVLILVDELLQYATKASGIKVGDSNLASQLLAFLQELTEAVSTTEKAQLILTLPSSNMEHYDEGAEILFSKLQKISGRVDWMFTPVEDEEIYPVIRRRLFNKIDKKEAAKVVDEYMEYAENENMLPETIAKSEYKKKFLKSYPFQPEVIDVLYKRWGSFPEFQRTRGVLRLLSLVISSLKTSKNSLIRLSDFDLSNENIKRELIKFAGSQFDSVVASDITAVDSGAKYVDKNIGSSYLSYSIGTKIATSIFLYSFSGNQSGKAGASSREIKLSCIETEIPSSIIGDALTKISERLFYLHLTDRRYFFLNVPNITRMHLTRKAEVSEKNVIEEEKELLKSVLGKKTFDIYQWPKRSNEIPDTKKLKLIVVRDKGNMGEFMENYGERPRVYRNTMLFLAPFESEKPAFDDFVKGMIAWNLILDDPITKLTPEQKGDVKDKIKVAEKDSKENIRNLYRLVYVPTRDGLKELDLGRHAYGMDTPLDYDIKDRLKGEDEITEKLAPIVLREKYLRDKKYVETKNILDSFYKTPGADRITSENVLKDAIISGVKKGLFGLGSLEEDEKIQCISFEESCTPYLQECEIMIDAGVCNELVNQPEDIEITSSEIKDLHLRSKNFVETSLILNTYVRKYKNNDEEEIKEHLVNAIKDGVKNGEYGLGQFADGEIECQIIENDCYPFLALNEVIIKPDLCKESDKNGEGKTEDNPVYKSPSSFKVRNTYLKDRDYVKTKDIFKSEVKDYEEEEISSKVKKVLATGVREGLFGLGELDEGIPKCNFFKEDCEPELDDLEIITKPGLCDGEESNTYKELELEFEVAVEKVPDIMRMINFLREPFDGVKATTEFKISAKNGEMPIADYDRIKETFEQLNIKITKEKKK